MGHPLEVAAAVAAGLWHAYSTEHGNARK